MKIELVRFAYLNNCTLAWWRLSSSVKIAGLAEAWNRGQYGIGGARRDTDGQESCIPDGTYEFHPHVSAAHPEPNYVWYFKNESLGVWAPGTRPKGQKWGRDAVLAHVGNDLDDTLGCELVGMSHSLYEGAWMLRESRKAADAMRSILGREVHEVTIRPSRGTREGFSTEGVSP